MSAQTQKMDVLAVIRSRANRADCNGLPVVDETLLEACTAVAELIETQRETLRMLEAAHRQLGMWTDDNKRINRAKAALAALAGGAA